MGARGPTRRPDGRSFPDGPFRTASSGPTRGRIRVEALDRARDGPATRQALEEACEAVRAAQEGLSKALEDERERRARFEAAKGGLEKLLEVPPAATTQATRLPSRLEGEGAPGDGIRS